MNGVNLIPEGVRLGLQRRARLRVWAGVTAAWAAVLVGALAVVTSGASADGSLRLRLIAAQETLDQREADLKSAKAGHAAVMRDLALAREVGRHPDWSELLAVLAASRGEDVVFERLELRPMAAAAGKGAGKKAPRSPGVTVRISGVASSQVAAAQYAVRLQESGLFDGVSPPETRARPTAGAAPGSPGASLVSFQVSVTMLHEGGAGRGGSR